MQTKQLSDSCLNILWDSYVHLDIKVWLGLQQSSSLHLGALSTYSWGLKSALRRELQFDLSKVVRSSQCILNKKRFVHFTFHAWSCSPFLHFVSILAEGSQQMRKGNSLGVLDDALLKSTRFPGVRKDCKTGSAASRAADRARWHATRQSRDVDRKVALQKN